jgi:serine-type D-Ala-D-Ala carboxypeptidase
MTSLCEALEALLRSHVAGDVTAIGKSATASAIEAVVSRNGDIVLDVAMGHRNLLVPERNDVTETTPMDIASLTKPLVGATLAMQAVDEGLANWDTLVGDLLGEGDAGLEPVRRATFLQLLNHGSGLPAWRQFYLEGFPFDPDHEQARGTRHSVLEAILKTPLKAPPGTVHEYSDLGYLLLAHVLEGLLGARLDVLARDRIFRPLELAHTRYVFEPDDAPIADAVATEVCPHRRRLVVGTVHDENTHIIGGVSAHAGVFSTARDVHRFAAHLLAIDQGIEPNGLVTADTLAFCWSPEAAVPGGSHRGGWDTPSGVCPSAGRGFTPHATVGHLGFSGTSVWIDRETGTIAVLLTNRVHPTRENPRIRDLRVAFHEAVQPPDAPV